ncbi:MAG: hypothetical protein ACKERG_03745 [Candidatus Hodgkinia cicadicola]
MCGLLVCLFVGLFGCVSALSASALAPSATLRPSVFSSFFLSLRRRGGGSCEPSNPLAVNAETANPISKPISLNL